MMNEWRSIESTSKRVRRWKKKLRDSVDVNFVFFMFFCRLSYHTRDNWLGEGSAKEIFNIHDERKEEENIMQFYE